MLLCRVALLPPCLFENAVDDELLERVAHLSVHCHPPFLCRVLELAVGGRSLFQLVPAVRLQHADNVFYFVLLHIRISFVRQCKSSNNYTYHQTKR